MILHMTLQPPRLSALESRLARRPASRWVGARCCAHAKSIPVTEAVQFHGRRGGNLVYSIAAAQAERPPPIPTATLMLGWVACALAGSLAVALLSLVPTLGAVRRTCDEISELVATIREEVPDTAATIRSSGLELSDTIEELGSLGADLGAGMRSGARALAAAEAGARQLGAAMRRDAVPMARRQLTPIARRAAARGTEVLEERAKLDEYSGPAIAAAAEGARAGAARVRKVLQATGVAHQMRPFLGRVVSRARSAWPKAGAAAAAAADAAAAAGEEARSTS